MSDCWTQATKAVLHPVSDRVAARAVYGALPSVPAQHDRDRYVGFAGGPTHRAGTGPGAAG
jgi:hypothetical protein